MNMKEFMYKNSVIEQADYLRFVGHKIQKDYYDADKIEKLKCDYDDVYLFYDYCGDEKNISIVRINTNDVFLHIYADGRVSYSLNPYWEYGAEFVESNSYVQFIKDVLAYEFSEEELEELYGCDD